MRAESTYFGTDECGTFDVQALFLLSAVLDLRLLFRKPYYMVGPYLLSLLDAGIALQGLITQVGALSIPPMCDSLPPSVLPSLAGIIAACFLTCCNTSHTKYTIVCNCRNFMSPEMLILHSKIKLPYTPPCLLSVPSEVPPSLPFLPAFRCMFFFDTSHMKFPKHALA